MKNSSFGDIFTKKSFMKSKYNAVLLLVLALLSLVLAACGDPTAAPATTTTAATTTAAATKPATTTAAATTAATTVAQSETKELKSIKTVVPFITLTLDNLKKSDVAAAKKSFADYSNTWNGIEVYVKARSADLYDVIEVQNEAKANKLFENPQANPAEITPFVEAIQKGFNDVIKMVQANPTYNPLLDEIGDIRVLRVNLRVTIAALKTEDVTTAKTAYKRFYNGWDDVEDSIKKRDTTIYTDIEAKMNTLAKELLEADKPVVSKAATAADALQSKYNEGLKLLSDELSKPK